VAAQKEPIKMLITFARTALTDAEFAITVAPFARHALRHLLIRMANVSPAANQDNT
jgi:hypothetical protein